MATPGIEIDYSELEAFGNKFTRHILDEPLKQFVQDTALVAERAAREGMPKDTSDGARSIVSRVNGLTATVGSPLVHVGVMDQGRRAGAKMPPPQSLVGWMRRHGMQGDPYPLARAIARRGIKGRFFYKKAADQTRAKLPALARKMADGIREQVRKLNV